MKAQELLKKAPSTSERAEKFIPGIKRSLQTNVIDKLIVQKEKIESKIFELASFDLETDVNRGVRRLTQDECEARFTEIINLEWELKLLEIEIKSKQESFNEYFAEEKAL